MSSEVRYRRLGARIRVPIRCVAIDTAQIRYKTEVLMTTRHDNMSMATQRIGTRMRAPRRRHRAYKLTVTPHTA